MRERLQARLVLEDGRCFEGVSCGHPGEVAAEVVFNTSLTGYQEILTDPSYAGQAVILTAVQVGNYGTNPEDEESSRVWASGLIVREAATRASNHRSTQTLREYLAENRVVAAEEMDTRAIVKYIRTRGAMRGVLSTEADVVTDELRQRAAASPSMQGRDLAATVACSEPYRWTEGFGESIAPWRPTHEQPLTSAASGSKRSRVVVVDFGVKRSILRSLVASGLDVDVVPGAMSAEAILERGPAGVVLSNGPGDPAAVASGIELTRGLVSRVPLLGICLGHQILALAAGASTFKLKFGHRGGNQPVRDLETGRVAITSHNHGFAVDPASLDGSGLKPWFENLNDGTCEGLLHQELPVLSVQFHPEAAPGPNDVATIFQRFAGMLASGDGSVNPAGSGNLSQPAAPR